MESTPRTENAWRRQKLSLSHTFVVFYLFLVSFVHEYAYWHRFHIQFLEHIGFADLPKLSVWPIAATAGTAIGYMVIHCVLAMPFWADRRLGRVLDWLRRSKLVSNPLFRLLIGIVFVVIGLCYFFVLRLNHALYIGPIFVAMGIVIAVDLKSALAHIGIEIPKYSGFLLVFAPCIAFGHGHLKASNIICGDFYLEARFTYSGPNLRYLGRFGDYVFLYDSGDRDPVLYKLESIQPLTLKSIPPE